MYIEYKIFLKEIYSETMPALNHTALCSYFYTQGISTPENEYAHCAHIVQCVLIVQFGGYHMGIMWNPWCVPDSILKWNNIGLFL